MRRGVRKGCSVPLKYQQKPSTLSLPQHTTKKRNRDPLKCKDRCGVAVAVAEKYFADHAAVKAAASNCTILYDGIVRALDTYFADHAAVKAAASALEIKAHTDPPKPAPNADAAIAPSSRAVLAFLNPQ